MILLRDDDVSIKSEDENSVGDGDSCGSGPESVIIEKEDAKSPSPEEPGVNGEEIINSSTSQAVISAGLVSTGGGYPRVLYQTSNGMMYAAPSPSLPNGVIFSLSPQVDPGGTGGSSSSRNHGNSRQQQLITIPFPVLSATPCSSNNRDPEQEAADLSRK